MSNYLEIMSGNKIYTQRTPTSKFIEFSLDGIKQNSYEELPREIKKISLDMIDMEQNPEKYFEYTVIDDGVKITKILEPNSHIKIPSFIEGHPVVELGSNLASSSFSINLKQIFLPDTILRLGFNCLKGTTNLEYVNIPKNLKSIPDGCFNGSGIRIIDLSDINTIGVCAFEDCTSLKTVHLSNDLKMLQSGAFKGCFELSQITLPENLEIIEGHVFEECYKLNKINLPNKVQQIGLYSFYRCVKLKEISLSKNLEYIGKYAFSKCGLETIEFKSKIKKIGEFAFYNCPNLNKLKMADASYFPLSVFGTHFIDKIELTNKTSIQENLEQKDNER